MGAPDFRNNYLILEHLLYLISILELIPGCYLSVSALSHNIMIHHNISIKRLFGQMEEHIDTQNKYNGLLISSAKQDQKFGCIDKCKQI